jgi:hypothetical protein
VWTGRNVHIKEKGGEIRQKDGVGKKDMIKHNKIWEKGDIRIHNKYYRAIPTARVQKKKSLSEVWVIESPGRKLDLAFQRTCDRSGGYC